MNFTLYYKNNCYASINILNIIRSNNLLINCLLVNIDNSNIPDNITNIPAIIVSNINNPLYNDDAINWINNIKFFNQTTNNINKNNVIMPSIIDNNLSCNKKELSSLSDRYTTLNDEIIEKNLLNIN